MRFRFAPQETACFAKTSDSLTPTRDFSRRDFVQTAVGSGFAAAVLPVSAQTITTDTAA
jgi:carboxymethylenebutenolidase